MTLEPDPEPDLEVRRSESIERAGDWSLVLHSAAVAHRIDIRDGRLVIAVAVDDGPRALAALDAYDAESIPIVEVPAPDLGPSPLGLALAVLITALHAAVGARGGAVASMWFAAGSASAADIVAGQWWRAITSLMLHADLLHLVGNVLASLLFVSAVGRWLGAGFGGAVVLAAATTGNLLTAWFYQARHVSVGASTATFAALGVLSGLQVVHRYRYGEPRRRLRAWFPLAAGLGLIVMLGSGERADIVAHLAGLGAGVVAGLLVAVSGVRTPGRSAQAMLGVLTVLALAGAWGLAFRAYS